MGTEIVVFDNISTFKNVYQLDYTRVGHKIEIVDFYTKLDEKGNMHLWVTTEYMAPHLTPDFGKTIVFFHNQDKEKFFNPLLYKQEEIPRLVEWNQVKYSQKDQRVCFGERGWWILKKPILEFQGNIRYYGNTLYNKKVKIDMDMWFYDFTRDRIILVIEK